MNRERDRKSNRQRRRADRRTERKREGERETRGTRETACRELKARCHIIIVLWRARSSRPGENGQKREYGHAIRDVTLRGSSVDRRDRAEHKYRYANTYDTRADTLVSRHAKTVPVTGDRDGAARVILERDFCRFHFWDSRAQRE